LMRITVLGVSATTLNVANCAISPGRRDIRIQNMRDEIDDSRAGKWGPVYLLEGSLIRVDTSQFSHPRSETLEKQFHDALKCGDALLQPDGIYAEVKRKMLCSSVSAAIELGIGRRSSPSSERVRDELGELLEDMPPERARGKTLQTSNGKVRIRLAADDETKPDRKHTSWPTTPDKAHNALVEATAIDFVRKNVSGEVCDRQPDNCGWDLEFKRSKQTLCVEVKGLSGDEIRVELTPNEYAAMNRAMTGEFSEGEYRLAVVTNAITAPRLFVFKHASGNDWVCERTGAKITAEPVVSARLTE
jgi:hypothetical protein